MFEIDKLLSFDTRDEYNRKKIAEKVIELLHSNIDISPMVIDGAWGTGKTEFTQKLINLYRKKYPDTKICYIDAFGGDSQGDPLLVLLAGLIQVLPQQEQKALIQKAIPALRFVLKAGIKAGVSWLLKQEVADVAAEFESDLKSASDEAINHAVESALQDHINADSNLQLLKTALGGITTETPFVLFVDELDRCRPDFALNTLEVIKHIFDITNLQIVLVANINQLEASIDHRYGLQGDSSRYLDKFVKFQFSLPFSHGESTRSQSLSSVRHFYNLLKQDEDLQNSRIAKSGAVKKFIEQVFLFKNVSLRECESFFRLVKVFSVVDTQNVFFDQLGDADRNILHLYGLYLQYFYPELVTKLSTDQSSYTEIASTLGKVGIYKGEGTTPHKDMADYIVAIFCFEEMRKNKEYKIQPVEIINYWQMRFSDMFFTQNTQELIDEIYFSIKTIKLNG